MKNLTIRFSALLLILVFVGYLIIHVSDRADVPMLISNNEKLQIQSVPEQNKTTLKKQNRQKPVEKEAAPAESPIMQSEAGTDSEPLLATESAGGGGEQSLQARVRMASRALSQSNSSIKRFSGASVRSSKLKSFNQPIYGLQMMRSSAGSDAYSSLGRSYPPPRQDFNTEEYSRITENQFIEVTQTPLSTFSIDVDAASYSNVRRCLNMSQLPPKDAVRIEELINYFSYNYPQPDKNQPFSFVTEVSECPWEEDHRLVHIGLQGEKIAVEKLPLSNLTFLIDVSGSMSSYDKLPLLKSSLRMLVQQMRSQDRVAIVVYAGSAGLVLESTPGDRQDVILASIDRLQSGGSTAGGAGIRLAYSIAKDNFIKKGNNSVILATDGDFNIGVSSTSELERLIEKKRKDGIFLTVLGFGTGNYKDSRMETLADKGNGNYAYIDNIHEARKVLVSEIGATLVAIAKDVKIQVEFNPTKVQAYRLLGYENRLLQKEDFNDDTKDAGEIGAGHTVTALYEIVPAGARFDLPKVDKLKYQTVQVNSNASASDELLTLKFRYKPPKKDKSRLIETVLLDEGLALNNSSDNFRFSAAVAEFGMLLRDSKFKGDIDYQDVAKLARSAKGEDRNGYRAEFIRLVEICEMLDKEIEVGYRD